MRILKHVPNMLSISRVVLVGLWFLLEPFSFWFMVLYVSAIITDIIDGPIARYTGAVSKFGSSLDGTADLIFAACAIYIFVPLLELSPILVVWIFILLGMRLTAIAIIAVRLKEYYTSHLITGRLTALSAALVPLIYIFAGNTNFIFGIAAFATFAFTEDILVSCKAKRVQVDLVSYFSKNASWRVD